MSKRMVPGLRFQEFESSAWQDKQLGQISETITGLSGKSGDDFGSGAPYITYKQVFDNSFVDLTQCGRVNIVSGEKQNSIRKGDILFTTSSETPNEVGYASVVMEDPTEPTYLNSFCFSLRPKNADELRAEFSRYLFHSQIYRDSVSVLAQGSTRYNISKGSFLNIKLPIPSLAEQQKIADCLSSLDDIITAQTQKLDLLKEHKKGLMQDLFPGEGENVPRLRFGEFEGDGEWEEKVVEDFFLVGSSKRVLQNEWTSEGIPFYRTRELVSLAKGERFRSEIFISQSLFDEISKKYGLPTEGDFLVSGVGTLGVYYQVEASEKFYFKDGNVLWFKLIGGIYSSFFKYCFESDFIQDQIIKQTSISTVGTYTIQNAKKTKVLVPLKLEEQQKIADCLSSIDDQIQSQTQQIESLKLHKKGLMQQLFPNTNN